ncbi:uncharacterized protein LOC133917517 [Phragmites australis]|uniref:uncharacterized protein LOC133917517 n=1 Tax=Phragmites australis TaxID=29695 RepID=UPI002D77F450|nr:uncharacterized protein LOC133917517 [Phragmites australis]
MENRRRQATRRLSCLIGLAGDYLKYLFMKHRRLLHKVARRTLALIHLDGKRKNPWPLMEYEFSCADSPSPAFLEAKRMLRSRLMKGGGAAAGAVPSCFGSLRATPCGSPDTTAAETETAEEEVEAEDDEEDQVAEDGWVQCGELLDVDDRAEEFINMFYEQLRAQSFSAVFQCSP